jgi:threonine/homoserine/homoserine lactone efflux protein
MYVRRAFLMLKGDFEVGTTWLNGVLLGIAVAAPLGPVNVAVIRTGLRAGFWPAWRVGVGAATVDAIYCMLAYLGLAPVLTRLPGFRPALWLVGGAFLVYLGLDVLRSDTALEADIATADVAGRPYLTGITITLLNPMTIIAWAAIAAPFFAAGIERVTAVEFIAGISTGVIIWFGGLSALLHGGRRLVGPQLFRLIAAVCGVTLVGFGGWFVLRTVGWLLSGATF